MSLDSIAPKVVQPIRLNFQTEKFFEIYLNGISLSSTHLTFFLEQTFEINCSQGNILKIGVPPKPAERQFIQEKDLGRINFNAHISHF